MSRFKEGDLVKIINLYEKLKDEYNFDNLVNKIGKVTYAPKEPICICEVTVIVENREYTNYFLDEELEYAPNNNRIYRERMRKSEAINEQIQSR